MENKCAICDDEIFASCHCDNCEGNGPLLCYEHFLNGPCPLEQNKPKEDATLMPKKEEFLSEVSKVSKSNSFILLPEEKAAIIDELRKAEILKTSKTRHQYRLLNRYKLIQNGEEEQLVERKKDIEETTEPRKVLSIDESYEVLVEIHKQTMHGGINMMLQLVKKSYSNITQSLVTKFVALCPHCASKSIKPKAGLVIKPIRSHNFASRGQIDLMDFQSIAYNGYRFIFNYQDHFTKFVWLRALKTKRAEEVASQLIEVFSILGPPAILQSDNGREFINSVISELKVLWPTVTIINGRPRHPQSQGSIERTHEDLKPMINSWCKENNTKDWPTALKFVTLSKNCRPHKTLGNKSPYEVVFAVTPKFGFDTTKLPEKIKDAMLNGHFPTEEEVFPDVEETSS